MINFLKFKRLLLLLGIISITTGAYAQSQLAMLEVIIEESEPGLDPYLSRYLLSEDFLRLDDGSDRSDFILFDRQTREIHSFNHEDRTHMLIVAKQAGAVDFKVDYKVYKKTLPDAPEINGNAPVEYQFFADAKKCKQVVSEKTLLPDLTQVLIDYEKVLAEQAKSTLSRIPDSIRTGCYMANNYLHVTDYLQGGFPLHVIDDRGRQKRLLTFRNLQKPSSILFFPAGYRVYSP